MKVVLTMIVKNEEPVIERVLRSCLPIIDGYCIVDTGSTDKTKEIITDFFSKHPKVKGKIVDYPFTTYADSRNVAIENAKEFGDWGFWIDADEELILNTKFNKNKFKSDVLKAKPTQLLINCDYNDLKYYRSQFYKLNDYEWYGPVHEILRFIGDGKEYTGKFTLGNCLIKAEGNSWKKESIADKYENHAKILLDYQIKNNWEDVRWTFYLAQSYKDSALTLLDADSKSERGLNLAKKAINFYKDRINNANKGFIEEVYYSQLMIARIMYRFQPIEQVILEFQKCEEYNVHQRVEHIFDLLILYQNKKMWRNGKIFGDLGHAILNNKSTAGTLFMENDIYTWRLYDTFAVILYYCSMHEQAIKVINFILNKHDSIIPEHDKERIKNNKKHSENILERKGVSI